VFSLDHDLFELLFLGCIVILDLVNLTELSDGFKELIRGACFLWLEECEPEYLSISALEFLADVFDQTVVNNIFKVN